jgi:hypothetical protein
MCSNREQVYDYSSFAHIVAGLFLSPETLVVFIKPDALSLYCDASGNERESLTVVGGVMAYARDWLEFIPRWNRALASEGIEYFRASEFAHSRGQFKKGWKDNPPRRDAFSRLLLETMAPTVKWWSGITVLQSEYAKADRIYKLHENFQPFALAGETTIENAMMWQQANHLDYLQLKYFFESGDAHWGQMSDRIKERFGSPPIPADKNDPPTQAADFVAYEVRQAYTALEIKSGEIFEKFRMSFVLLGQTPGRWGDLKDQDIRAELNVRKIPKRGKRE